MYVILSKGITNFIKSSNSILCTNLTTMWMCSLSLCGQKNC